MMVPSAPAFAWGQPVLAHVALYNDGSYPDCDAAALLVEEGAPGEVVQIGRHEPTGAEVYLVEFSGGRIVGCLEQDIVARPPR